MESPVDAITEKLIAPVIDHVRRHDPGTVAGFYLYGSAISRLRPDSDVDLLLLTRRSLTADERANLITLLLAHSGWPGHAERFPEAADRRPLEFTSLVLDDIVPLLEWPSRDFQYGEWKRAELIDGALSPPTRDPDIVTLLATAHAGHRALFGPPLEELVQAVHPDMLRRAVVASIPGLLDDLDGDERNVLLTLARAVVTARDGRIVSKDAAADRVAAHLDGHDRALLERARDGYRGIVDDDWSGLTGEAASLARRLAELAVGLET
ncbi:DUF4111 domain-containing protein [Aeromicrobium sp. YIM 150415]|uniref:aminoglycoside adenylyltransferase domain-containing protein n=1 Tax=Aeromicrobium sp. YIM 150415 TaxID=2803912 RepID=UPI00196322A4|nr:aminoglycoside adenylyltransferase domain-containing protein [Aeromicrobium sp. YIM 150415]MBM9463094.1 DUF4111 domain-containing protein [Aeromicrobium sp. YIM 150415]